MSFPPPPPPLPPNHPAAPRPSPLPPRRPFSPGEILAWIVILLSVAIVAYRASVNQYRMAASHDPDFTLPARARYAVGVRDWMIRMQPAQQTQITKQLMDDLDQAAEAPEDQLRIALVAGEFLGEDPAILRLHALRDAHPDLAADAATAESLLRGQSVGDSVRAAFDQEYPWFSQLAQSRGKPPGDPQRAAVLQRAYATTGISLGGAAFAGLLLLAGLPLLIVAIVFLAMRKLKLAMSHADPADPARRADRRTYVYSAAVYLGGYGGFLAVLLLVRQILGPFTLPIWASLPALFVPFTLALLLPLLLGQSRAQWRQAFGLHTGRGIIREMLAGLVGYLAGVPLMALGILLVILLTHLTGIKGSHPIVEELGGNGWEIFLLFLMASGFAPITEELMFRGALFAHLRERFPWWISALAMGAIFALVHPQSWVALPVLAAIAIVFAGIREWRGSIIGSMTAHALHNGLALVFSLLLMR